MKVRIDAPWQFGDPLLVKDRRGAPVYVAFMKAFVSKKGRHCVVVRYCGVRYVLSPNAVDGVDCWVSRRFVLVPTPQDAAVLMTVL